MLNLGNLNLYNEETCIGLSYLFEFLNLFTFIYLTQTTEVNKTTQTKAELQKTERTTNYTEVSFTRKTS